MTSFLILNTFKLTEYYFRRHISDNIRYFRKIYLIPLFDDYQVLEELKRKKELDLSELAIEEEDSDLDDLR